MQMRQSNEIGLNYIRNGIDEVERFEHCGWVKPTDATQDACDKWICICNMHRWCYNVQYWIKAFILLIKTIHNINRRLIGNLIRMLVWNVIHPHRHQLAWLLHTVYEFRIVHDAATILHAKNTSRSSSISSISVDVETLAEIKSKKWTIRICSL